MPTTRGGMGSLSTGTELLKFKSLESEINGFYFYFEKIDEEEDVEEFYRIEFL